MNHKFQFETSASMILAIAIFETAWAGVIIFIAWFIWEIFHSGIEEDEE